MISPCIKKCNLKNNICISCHRTLDQIQNWMYYTEQERENIIEILKMEKLDDERTTRNM
jgi:predicted Fe-S protein YdhL (DUF1289 family)